jgi:hydrogenase maturation factor HypF (carbamoyltransferase family)
MPPLAPDRKDDPPIASERRRFRAAGVVQGVGDRLERLGFRVLTHRRVPPNDGGISYGEAAVTPARTA